MICAMKNLYSLLILLILCKLIICLNSETKNIKRDLSSKFDKSIFSFNGFEKIASVPVLFPNDICMLNVNDVQFAAALHTHKSGQRQLTVFRLQNAGYEIFTEVSTPYAIYMDCLSYGNRGYIALAYNLTEPPQQAQDGSPIYELTENSLRTVQYFAATHLSAVYLSATGNENLFMLQTYTNTNKSQQFCPYYKWSGSTFDQLGRIPCSSAKQLEPFSMNYEQYVVVANFADRYGHKTTYSEIYKYSSEKEKFVLFQKIRTHGAVDVRYFIIPNENMPNGWQHFLIFANTINANNQSKDALADSVFYTFDQTSFVPYQSISLYAVEQFLPVENVIGEKFLLLVSSANQDIKIYNFNNWKFEESQIQFTDGALSKGVAKMRIHQQHEETFLVIANKRMLENETNIFRPIFKQEENANELRQQIIDWTEEQMNRLSKIDINNLMQNVEIKLSSYQKNKDKSPSNVPKYVKKSNIATVNTKSLVYPRLNLNSNYWKVLSYANQGLDALNTHEEQNERSKRQLTSDMKAENWTSELNVGTLIVENKLVAKQINGVKTSNPEFKNIKANKVIVNKVFDAPKNSSMEHKNTTTQLTEIEELNVKNLQLTGKLNNLNWLEDLVKMTLKRNASQQFVKSRAIVGYMRAEAVIVNNDKINDRKINQLVSTQSGSYVIDQHIQFAAPISARELVINERLNNIHVLYNKLNVLLRHSNVTQVIEGPKRFESIKVLEPITLSGRMLGKELDSMAPGKVIKNNLELSGDFTITGDVNISKMFKINDLIVMDDDGAQMSAKKILHNGIIMAEENLQDLNIEFQQPLNANNSLVSFVNGRDLQNLLRTHTAEHQIIEGHKIMPTHVSITKGHAEVKLLNSINVESLNEQLLLKHSNQTICAPMHFGNVITMGINAKHITVNGSDISSLLTKSSNQEINGILKVGKMNARKLNTTHLNANGKIFNAHVREIYEQKAKNSPNHDTFNTNHKFYGNILVENLKMSIESDINGRKVEMIERQLTQFIGNIKYVGNYHFNYPMNVTMLNFEGELNGIKTEHFGSCWLQRNTTQTFTAPQNFANITCPAGILLQDKLNGHTMSDFMQSTYWTNRHEYLTNAHLLQDTQIAGTLYANSTNGLQIPRDLLLKFSTTPQVINNASISVQGDLFVHENKSINVEIINDLHMPLLKNFLTGQSTGQSLHLENAHFKQTPMFMRLNGYNLNDLLDAVWLLNEDINLQNLEISEANFIGLLDFEGALNGIDLRFLEQNYFSLTRPQQIRAQFVFNGDVHFAQNLDIVRIHLMDKLIEHKSNTVFDFNEFVAKSLKISGYQEITGKWFIENALLNGDILNVKINNLNLAQDILRVDLPIQEISVIKNLNKATIQNLYALESSSVNNVGVANWIRDAVLDNKNYTIRGVTTIDSIKMFNDLLVYGHVNNMIFSDQYLMLRDRPQTIHGDVFVRNKLASQGDEGESQIMATNFNKLYTETINGIHLGNFFKNQVQMSSVAQVNAHLIFTQPVVVDEYETLEETGVKSKRDIATLNCNHTNANIENLIENFHEISEGSQYTIDHFEVRQVMSINATRRIIPLTLHMQEQSIDVIGVFRGPKNDEQSHELLNFFYWKEKQQKFIFDRELSWLPHDDYLLDLFELGFVNADYLLVEKTLNLSSKNHTKVLSNSTNGLQEVLELKQQNNVVQIKLQGEDCNAIYGSALANVPVYCLMIDDLSNLGLFKKTEIYRANVQQILEISNSSVGLLLEDVLEIWYTEDQQPYLVQKISTPNAKSFTVQKYEENDKFYLAVILMQENSVGDAVEIFSSTNALHFEHQQTIANVSPRHVEFFSLRASRDLLLYVNTANVESPLLIYQYKGALNFVEMVTKSSLPLAEYLQVITLKTVGRHFIVLINQQQITFVEIMLELI